MFTGLVQRIGTVKRVSRGAGLVVEIAADTPCDRRRLGGDGWTKPLEEGESVAVNGVCLTVVKCDGSRFTADVLRETESRTGLGELVPGTKVNLERALRAGDAMGGHIVQGHVDCRGTIAAKTPKGRDFQLKVRCGRVLASQSVLKGSIAIDGVSLTPAGDALLSGHTHSPLWQKRDGVLCLNPGSVSIPKEGSENSYMTLENGVFLWKALDGTVYHRETAICQ